jgi:hypothetical protein
MEISGLGISTYGLLSQMISAAGKCRPSIVKDDFAF